MFKVRVIDINKTPEWVKRSHKNGDVFEISDSFALYISKKGGFKLLEHFKYKTIERKPCPTCGKLNIKQEKVIC